MSSTRQTGGPKNLSDLVDGLARGVRALSDDPGDSQSDETVQLVERLRSAMLIILRKCVQQRARPSASLRCDAEPHCSLVLSCARCAAESTSTDADLPDILSLVKLALGRMPRVFVDHGCSATKQILLLLIPVCADAPRRYCLSSAQVTAGRADAASDTL